MANLETLGTGRISALIGETCTRYECFWKHASLGFADALKNSSRKVKEPAKVESNLGK